MKRNLLIALISLSLLVVIARTAYCLPANAATSQQVTLDRQAENIKHEVEKLGVGHKITVVLNIGGEHSGTISKIESESFQINEVDKKREVTVWYNETKKIYNDYYHKDLMLGRNPRKHQIVLVSILSFVAVGLIYGIAHRSQ
jgi:hypothetical protein